EFLTQFAARCGGPLVRPKGKFILHFTRDAPVTCERFRGLSHVTAAHGIRKSELESDARREIGRAKLEQPSDFLPRCPGFRELAVFARGTLIVEQRITRHAFGAADEKDVAATSGDLFRGLGERL